MKDDTQREAFEKWWTRESGTYNLGEVFAWKAWQAAHASRDAEVAELQSVIDGQRDTIGALKRKLAMANAEVEALAQTGRLPRL